MEWHVLSSSDQLQQIIEESYQKPTLIFKHSTRCSISHMAKSRLERESAGDDLNYYCLDLIAHRDLSNLIAEKFGVYHESPQILLLKQGECIYDESHNGIRMQDIIEQAFA